MNYLNLDVFLATFSSLEKTVFKVHANNSEMELMLEDSSRVLKHSEAREKALLEERDSLLATVKQLQQSLKAQCNIRVENERLNNELEQMKIENAKKAKEAEAEVQRHMAEMRDAAAHHQGELYALRCQSRSDVEEVRRQAEHKMAAQASEAKQQLEEVLQELEEMRRWQREQEREHQSQVLKLRVEFGATLARVQSQQQQQQQQYNPYLHQNIYKRKLQFFQEEKNKEVAELKQRIKELEESQLTGLKRRKVSFNI